MEEHRPQTRTTEQICEHVQYMTLTCCDLLYDIYCGSNQEPRAVPYQPLNHRERIRELTRLVQAKSDLSRRHNKYRIGLRLPFRSSLFFRVDSSDGL